MAARIRKRRLEIVRLKIRHLVENLRRVETSGKKIEHVTDPNSHPANTGVPAALLRVDGDSVEKRAHAK